MDIHCVVTGQDELGKSVIVRHTPSQPVRLALLPGYEFHRIWGSDSIPELPSDGTPPRQPRYFPEMGGFRFGFFTIPPDTMTSVDQIGTQSAVEEIKRKLPGMIDVLEPDHPGMHTTDTVDFDVVVSGEVYLELDDGAEVLLKAGDCVIQNGTRHAWHNRSSEKCLIAVCLLGAARKRTT
jgi:mannose-6-phosphate isomerase-like protein (cupin superfamily)